MKEIICHQTTTRLPKHSPKKINQATCIICYIENMKTSPKGTAVDTTNLQPEELIHTDFALYNVN